MAEAQVEEDAESSDGFDNFNDPFKDNIAQTLDNPADSHVEEQVAEAHMEKDAESSDGFDNFNDPFKDEIVQTLENPTNAHV